MKLYQLPFVLLITDSETGKKDNLWCQSLLDLALKMISSEFGFYSFLGSAFYWVASAL